MCSVGACVAVGTWGGYVEQQKAQMGSDYSASAARDEEVEERDHRFNAYRFAASENAKRIMSEVIRLLLNYEAYFGRKNTTRDVRADQETLT